MDRIITPCVSHKGQRQQQQSQMYPDGGVHRREQQVYPSDAGVHRRAQQQQRQLMSTSEDGMEVSTPIPSRRAPVEQQNPHVRSSDSEWTPRCDWIGTFPARQFGEPSCRGDSHFEYQHQEQHQWVLSDTTVRMPADRPRHSTAIRHQYGRDDDTRSSSRQQHKADYSAMTSMSEHTGSPRMMGTKIALGFIMNQDEQPSARFDRAVAVDLHCTFRNRDSRRRPSSPRIASRLKLTQTSFDLGDEFEEKQSIDNSSSVAIYTPAQEIYSDAPTRARPAISRGSTSTGARRVASHPPPFPSTMNRDCPAIAGGNARPRLRTAASSGTNQEKRRARECKIDGCPNYIINKGLCFRHGGGKKCSEEGCTKSAKHGGKCWRHGGSLKCLINTCTRKGKTRGFCWAHGGGTKCSSGTSCSKVAVSNGLCWAHGGGKRCVFEGCEKAAYKRTHNYCVGHYDLLKDGNVTLEV